MLFPTFEFALFFLLVFGISWGLRYWPEGRKWFLTGASYFFYGYWDVRFCLLLFGCSFANYLFGLALGRAVDEQGRRRWLNFAIIFNLGILAFFKYFEFFTESLSELLTMAGLARDLPMLEILLPVGISFFTFQGISYVVDIYRREIEPSRSLVDMLLYISFFPQLVAGPIVRAAHFFPQLRTQPDFQRIAAGAAMFLILVGLFKKVVVAHYLSEQLVQPVFDDPLHFSSLDLLFAAYGYAVQIYCDFSAYTDIAIGVAALLGYHFQQNFDQPYRAQSLQEFWRRWHISLSSWLRDYLYIPLGGSRQGKWKSYRNLLLTMLLGGLWHGAAWKFVAWGAMHGGYLAGEKWLRDRFGPLARGPWSRALATLIVFHFVCLTWIFFAADSYSTAIDYLWGLFTSQEPLRQLTGFTFLLVLGGLLSHFLPEKSLLHWRKGVELLPIPLQGVLAGAMTVLIIAIGPSGVAPFIYFQF